MSEFPKRRELYDHEQRGYQNGMDDEWWRIYGELEALEQAESQSYFIEKYGQILGNVASSFSLLGARSPEDEFKERQNLIKQVEYEMDAAASGSPQSRHPILAVIEATELRANKNYIAPEDRSNVPYGTPSAYVPQFNEPSETESDSGELPQNINHGH